jgi:hypothetical protein
VNERSSNLCPELDAILRFELHLGNVVTDGPTRADWPANGSVFAALRDDLHLAQLTLAPSVQHSVCHDPHYGWHDECCCELHKHTLVAGVTKLSSD